MKQILYLLAFVLMCTQASSQSANREIKKISSAINEDETEEASEDFARLTFPSMDDGSKRYAISYLFLKFTLLKEEDFDSTDVKNALDTISKIRNLYKSMPKKGWFKKNTQKKTSKHCTLIKGKTSFDQLEKYWQNTLVGIRKKNKEEMLDSLNESMVDVKENKMDSLAKASEEKDRVIEKEKANSKKQNDQNKLLKRIVADSLKKSTIRETASIMQSSSLPEVRNARHDSVLVEFDVYELDSVAISVALVEGEHNLGEYQSPKPDALLENGVSNIIIRWIDAFNIGKGNTLLLSLRFSGFADDYWSADGKLKILTKDPHGIAAQMGLKVGDKFSNDILAKLRCLNAEYCFRKGLEQTEAFMKNKVYRDVHIKVISVRRMSKDYLQEPGEQKGFRFRKQSMTLKYEGKE